MIQATAYGFAGDATELQWDTSSAVNADYTFILLFQLTPCSQ